MEIKLSEITKNQMGIVKKVEGEGKIRKRLFDMGITQVWKFF